MSTDYTYDEQVRLSSSEVKATANTFKGQFFPFFILTMTGLVTFPLTYSLLKPSKGMVIEGN